MTYKPIKTETGWGVMLKDGSFLLDAWGNPWRTKRKEAKIFAAPSARVVPIRVTYEVGE